MLEEAKDTEQKPLHTGFGSTTTAAEVIAGIDLEGKVAIVTGGSAGIGLETVRVLSGAGAHVIVGARDPKKTEKALAGVNRVELWPWTWPILVRSTASPARSSIHMAG